MLRPLQYGSRIPLPQYTVFEQLKNILVARRTAKLRAAGGTAKAIAVLSDMDYLWLGAISKLGMSCIYHKIWALQLSHVPRFSCDFGDLSIRLFMRPTFPSHFTDLLVRKIVIKSRLQSGQDTALKYKSSWDGILSVIKHEGVTGLYKGIGSKLTQSVITAAILFAGQKRIYELTRTVRISGVTPVCNTTLKSLTHACRLCKLFPW